jgi:MFS family permease
MIAQSCAMLPVVRRNLFLLASCQALFMTGSSMVLTVTALTGEALWPGSGLATLPISLQFVVTMVATVPASFVMRRFGRRAGFQIGAVIGLISGLVNVLALMGGYFFLFCVGSALLGVLNGFALYYRFAAADCADEESRSKAISLVLAGGVVAAFSGPNLARITVDAFADVAFAGSFVALAGIQVVTISLLMFVDIPRLSAEERRDQGRPLMDILRIPAVPVAIIAAMAGYSSMTLVMTSTPLAMDGTGHGFGDTAFVIQWHVFAMFAPAFVTGHLIKRVGALPVILRDGEPNGPGALAVHHGADGVGNRLELHVRRRDQFANWGHRPFRTGKGSGIQRFPGVRLGRLGGIVGRNHASKPRLGGVELRGPTRPRGFSSCHRVALVGAPGPGLILNGPVMGWLRPKGSSGMFPPLLGVRLPVAQRMVSGGDGGRVYSGPSGQSG